jgi:hypothetical protein
MSNLDPCDYGNISDLLEALDFTWDDTHEYFRRNGQYIAPEDLYGHTPASFYGVLQNKLQDIRPQETNSESDLDVIKAAFLTAESSIIPSNVQAVRTAAGLTVSWDGQPHHMLTEIEWGATADFALFTSRVTTGELRRLTVQARKNALFVRVRFVQWDTDGEWCEPVMVKEEYEKGKHSC